MPSHLLLCAEWPQASKYFQEGQRFRCVIADPPTNLGLANRSPPEVYTAELKSWVTCGFSACAFDGTMWVSFDSKHTIPMARIVMGIQWDGPDLLFTPMVQRLTYYKRSKHDFSSAHRPLWRLRRTESDIYPEGPEQIKTATPASRVPSDVFDFPRVARQRRKWCPTQLPEGLVERCVLSCTQPGDTVLDLFSGSGTAIRVCKRIDRNTISVESSRLCCQEIAREHRLEIAE